MEGGGRAALGDKSAFKVWTVCDLLGRVFDDLRTAVPTGFLTLRLSCCCKTRRRRENQLVLWCKRGSSLFGTEAEHWASTARRCQRVHLGPGGSYASFL